MKKIRGFTLIEIMVVVVIIGLLAALIVPSVVGKVSQASATKAKSDIQAIGAALELYKLDMFSYPTGTGGLQALVTVPSGETAANWKGPYLKKVGKDPWGRDYLYQSPGSHGEYDVYSYGADGQQGGEKENADIGNWDL